MLGDGKQPAPQVDEPRAGYCQCGRGLPGGDNSDSLSPLPACEASPGRGGVWSGLSVGDGDLFNMMLASLSPEDALCAWPQDFFTHVSNPPPE